MFSNRIIREKIVVVSQFKRWPQKLTTLLNNKSVIVNFFKRFSPKLPKLTYNVIIKLKLVALMVVSRQEISHSLNQKHL